MIKPKFVQVALQVWPQWAVTMTVTLLSISLGLVAGSTSPFIAMLTMEDSALPITDEEASWVASLMPLGRLFGAVAGSVSLEYFGGKLSVLGSGVPLIIGWICIICANSPIWLYLSRMLSGASMGMVFSSFPLFIGEIASPNIRGALVSLVVNGMPLGTLMGNLMGSELEMMWFGIISLIVSLCYIVIFPFVPQSPHYLVRRNDIDGAKASIKWYQRRSNAEAQLEDIQRFINASKEATFCAKLKLVAQLKNRRAFTICILLYIFMQLSGLNTVVFYMETIFRKAQISFMPPSTIVVIINALSIIVGWLGVYLVDRCGRRILLAYSSCGVGISMMLLGTHFMLLELNVNPADLQWLPILSLMFFTSMNMGLALVPSAMLSELFSADVKSLAGFVASIVSALFAFLASKTFDPLSKLIGVQYVFWIYAFIMVLSFIYALKGVPETKGKTLQEVQELLIGERIQTGESETQETKSDNRPEVIRNGITHGNKT